jgi:biotin carboxyl carrier protein
VKVSVTHGDRRLVVDIPDAAGEPLLAAGEPAPADLVEVRPGLYSLLVSGRSYEVVIERAGSHGSPSSPSNPSSAIADEVTAHVGGVLLELQLEDERRRALAAAMADRRGERGQATSTTLAAPMPGRVVAVPATPGASVERGQPLVVLEAMKMESALNAPHAGVVAEVLVGPGQTVQQRQPLVRLERRE